MCALGFSVACLIRTHSDSWKVPNHFRPLSKKLERMPLQRKNIIFALFLSSALVFFFKPNSRKHCLHPCNRWIVHPCNACFYACPLLHHEILEAFKAESQFIMNEMIGQCRIPSSVPVGGPRFGTDEPRTSLQKGHKYLLFGRRQNLMKFNNLSLLPCCILFGQVVNPSKQLGLLVKNRYILVRVQFQKFLSSFKRYSQRHVPA